MIPFYSDITEEDVEKTDEIVKFYVGSYDNITEANKHRIIDIFTDSGRSQFKIYNKLCIFIQLEVLLRLGLNYVQLKLNILRRSDVNYYYFLFLNGWLIIDWISLRFKLWNIPAGGWTVDSRHQGVLL